MTAAATYLAGDWVAVSAPGLWLLVDLPPGHATVRRCWDVVSSGGDVEDLFDVLVDDGIRAAPSFALVAAGTETVRVIARGAGSVQVLGREQPYEIAAAARSLLFDGEVDADEVILTGGKAGAPEVELPMAVGVTLAASVRLRLGANAASVIVEPAAAADPVPALAQAPKLSDPPLVDEAASVDEPASAVVTSDDDPLPSYDHLFGATQRPSTPGDARSPVPVTDADPGEAPSSSQDPGFTATWNTSSSTMAAEVYVPTPSTPPPPAAAPNSPLIDAVPGFGSSPATAPPPVVAEAVTIPPLLIDEPPEEVMRTTSRAQLRTQVVDTPTAAGPTVLAGRCPNGHLTPVHAPTCRVCGTPVPEQQGVVVARPPLGVLRMPSGDSVALDRGVLIGRAPTAPSDAAERPHLVRVSSPENDVSRTHAEIVLDGWQVFVRDLGSTNGTTVELPGQAPVRLRKDDLQLLEPGAVITLADEIRCVFEVTS
jgi:hypothetical protein